MVLYSCKTLTRIFKMDWFLSQSPDQPEPGPLHQHTERSPPPMPDMPIIEALNDEEIYEIQTLNPVEYANASPQSPLFFQNQMEDPSNTALENIQPSVQEQIILTQDDINRYVLFDEEPISRAKIYNSLLQICAKRCSTTCT
ncbi:hypothetical protein PoB_001293100 [Plakobranchus ocellatus]|uniref:Uncharacterized protein n=1 Tax=Plakobranchus ocellatus TaxID=259542 RepID=A0AAV3YVL5_9GAST|nr:hypothetical protein PoB_001293100 [Plakobranchus ocellatus]